MIHFYRNPVALMPSGACSAPQFLLVAAGGVAGDLLKLADKMFLIFLAAGGGDTGNAQPAHLKQAAGLLNPAVNQIPQWRSAKKLLIQMLEP